MEKTVVKYQPILRKYGRAAFSTDYLHYTILPRGTQEVE